MSQYGRAVWMLGGWQAQWAEHGWGLWWNVPNFDSLLLLPGNLTPLHSCRATFHIRTSRSIQTRGDCSLRCLHILGVGGLVCTPPPVLPKSPWTGEGKEVLAAQARRWYQKQMDSKECTKPKPRVSNIPGPGSPFPRPLSSNPLMPLPWGWLFPGSDSCTGSCSELEGLETTTGLTSSIQLGMDPKEVQ